MKMKNIFWIMAALPLALGAQTTQKLTATKASEYGIIYSLPKTAIDITIETSHTVTEPGEFANYANRHLGITDAIRTPDAKVSVKSITVNTHGVPDPDNRWLAQFKAGSAVSMTLTEAGIPLAINYDGAVEPTKPVLPEAQEAEPTPLEGDAARQAVTLEMTRSTSQSKKAELAAQRIFELREQRGDLISGNADNMPPDGSALRVALDGLDEQEAALTAMFAGTTQTFTDVQTVSVVPSAVDSFNIDGRQIVARISPVDGIVETTDMSGIPLYLNIRTISRGELPVNDKGEVKRFPKGGVAYTIPGSAEISMEFEGRTLARTTVDLAQLGVTFGIDPGLFTDRKAPAFVEFSPVTGAITRLDNVAK